MESEATEMWRKRKEQTLRDRVSELEATLQYYREDLAVCAKKARVSEPDKELSVALLSGSTGSTAEAATAAGESLS